VRARREGRTAVLTAWAGSPQSLNLGATSLLGAWRATA